MMTVVQKLSCQVGQTFKLIARGSLARNIFKMWPLLMTSLRTYAPYITLPFAGLVGFIGYNLENLLSDKYTPYNKSIKEQRGERLLAESKLDITNDPKDSLKPKHSVLGTNLSPSLS